MLSFTAAQLDALILAWAYPMARILGIDHGEARIGLAISDELGMMAHPLATMAPTATATSIFVFTGLPP